MQSTSASTISRRNLTQGALWSTPVILSTSSIPAYAASACHSHTNSFTSGWTYQNPVSGTLAAPGSNRVYTGADGITYYNMFTSSSTSSTSLVRASGTITSSTNTTASLKAGCIYTVSFGITTGRPIGSPVVHPTMTVYLRDPNGREVTDSRSSYTTNPNPPAGITHVPLAANRVIQKQANGKPFTFTAIAGNYTWVTEFSVPGRPTSAPTTVSTGIGFSAPIFTV